MKRECFFYNVESEIVFTRQEIEYLMKLSQSHYDLLCQQCGRTGGFIYGWKMLLAIEGNKEISVFATSRQLDYLVKICEQEDHLPQNENLLLHYHLQCLLKDANKESLKMNPDLKD